MRTVRCPDCAQAIPVPESVNVGHRFECPF